MSWRSGSSSHQQRRVVTTKRTTTSSSSGVRSPKSGKISEVLVESDGARGGQTLQAKEALMAWAQRNVKDYPGVQVKDFGRSWRDGLAFNAIIHRNRPDLIDFQSLKPSEHRANLERAFSTAEKHLGVTRLLDPEDVDVPKPDDKSIMTYVSSLYNVFPKVPESSTSVSSSERKGGKTSPSKTSSTKTSRTERTIKSTTSARVESRPMSRSSAASPRVESPISSSRIESPASSRIEFPVSSSSSQVEASIVPQVKSQTQSSPQRRQAERGFDPYTIDQMVKSIPKPVEDPVQSQRAYSAQQYSSPSSGYRKSEPTIIVDIKKPVHTTIDFGGEPAPDSGKQRYTSSSSSSAVNNSVFDSDF